MLRRLIFESQLGITVKRAVTNVADAAAILAALAGLVFSGCESTVTGPTAITAPINVISPEATLDSWSGATLNNSAATQASRVAAIAGRLSTYSDGMFVGLQCKRFVSVVVADATSIIVPSTGHDYQSGLPVFADYSWNVSPYVDVVVERLSLSPSGWQSVVRPYDAIQAVVTLKGGGWTQHTMFVQSVLGTGIWVKDANYSGAGTVMTHFFGFADIGRWAGYSIYRINGRV